MSMHSSEFERRRVIQRQIDQAWEKFCSEVSSEEEAVEFVYSRLFTDNYVQCFYCSSKSLHREYGERFFSCMDCGLSTWFTSGTFFHRAKRLRPLLAAIWFLEQGVCVNPFRFHKLLEVAYSSARAILHKLAMVVRCNMSGEFLSIPSAMFVEVICKRSSETPRREHPRSELDLSMEDDDHEAVNDCFTAKTFDLSADEMAIYDLIGDEPVHMDSLCSNSGMPSGEVVGLLVVLEIIGAVKCLHGNRYIRVELQSDVSNHSSLSAENSSSLHQSTSISKIQCLVGYLKQVFQGISRKYLQNYLAIHWSVQDKESWGPRKLLSACKQHGIIQGREVFRFVSPYIVLACPG